MLQFQCHYFLKNGYSGHVMGNQDIGEFLVVVGNLDLY